MAKLISINPYTEEINASFETINESEIDAIIGQSHSAYLSWKNTSN